MSQPNKCESGFTMIEVLIAVLIFAIGLLGVAGMQTLALKSTNNSNVRTLVNLHAYEIAERMRANMLGAEAGYYDEVTVSTGASDCRPSCTPQELAAWDADEWLANLQADIPTATASVDYTNGTAVITINWSERSLGDDEDEQTYVLRARIN